MLITKIKNLKNILDLKNDNEKKLFEKASFLYELSSHYGNSISDIYINLETAAILYSDYHADMDTVVSALIYRIIKKMDIPDKEILRLFNENIKNKVNLLLKFDSNLYTVSNNNHLQMVKSLTRDVSVTIIKLIERTVTFNYMKRNNIDDNQVFVNDTLNFYVPISKLLGIYEIKNKLEDGCFKYNNSFNVASSIVKKVNREYKTIIKYVDDAMKCEDIGLLNNPEFRINKKSGYDILRKADEIEQKVKVLKKKDNINLLGFCSIKCLLDKKEDCYKVLYLLHKFKPIFGSFNDYIGGSQGNEYHAIHTSVFIEGHVVDFRICTKYMDYVNCYGITSAWKEKFNLQDRLKSNYDFYSELLYLENSLSDEELVDVFMKNILESKELKGEYLDLNMQKFLLEEKRNLK